MQRYDAHTGAFDDVVRAHGELNMTSAALDALMERTYNPVLRQMLGVPARTSDDTLAAMDWLREEGKNFAIELGGDSLSGQVAQSLVNAVRDYLVTAGSTN